MTNPTDATDSTDSTDATDSTDSTDATETAEQTDTTTDQSLVVALAARASPLAPEPDETSVPEGFATAVGDAAVVGLGEASHGARECFTGKTRLLRHLVTEADCRVFALEASLPAVRAIDNYVAHGEGTPADALGSLHIWPWNTAAVADLLEWLRSFNADRPLANRVRVHGIDCQYTTGAVASIRRFLDDTAPDRLASLTDELDTADDGGTPPIRDDDPAATADAAECVAAAARDVLASVTDEFGDSAELDDPPAVDASPELDTSVARRVRADCRTLEAAAELRRVYVGTDGVPDELSNTRDETMADEVTRLAERADAPVAVWAHDSHLDRQRRRPRVDHVDPAPSAGSSLADRFGDDYVLVQFSLGAGAVTAVTETDEGSAITSVAFDGPTPGTVEATLEAAVDGPALFDVRVDDPTPRGGTPCDATPHATPHEEPADADPATAWLTTPHDHFTVGATFDGDPSERLTTLVPARATDFWWHLPEVSPTDRLPTEE